jgi:quinol---cytochrome-c reductase cytochrome b subunit
MAGQELPTAVRWVDDRVGIAKLGRKNLRKVFPDHWSFMLGEIALYSFVILILTGVFLTFWFRPSMAEVEYQGSYSLLKGLPMSEAYESTLRISFDIRGGLLMRQIHHWAAVLFVAAMSVHLLRVFFTGAFRKPRELNWLIGIGMLFLGIVEGFIGYGLPDDLLSGTGLRITEGLVLASPVIGTYLSFFIFGGQFPSDDFVSRFYTVHVLLIPGILLALITAHLFLVIYHKHTQFPGPGRTEKNVVGLPLMPVYLAKAGGFFFVVFGILAMMGALLQINPVWLYGPYNPAEVTAGSQPDWYMAWLDGAVRLMPGIESHFWGITISWNIVVPALLVPPLFIGFVALYPFLEHFVTGDNREHHLLDRPRNQPTRTGLGVAIITFYGILWLNSGNDLIATHFHLSINTITWVCRVLIILGPVIAFVITRRIALSLQRADLDRVLHGRESGIIVRSPDGRYYEKHVPLNPYEAYALTTHEQHRPIDPGDETDSNGVRRPHPTRRRLRSGLSRFYFADTLPPREEADRPELTDAKSSPPD